MRREGLGIKSDTIMTEIWRFIEDYAQSGSFNMAADQVLLQQIKRGNTPTLRLYTWNQLTLSIGKNQRLDQIETGWCHENGVALVRRSTGGQAVLHGGDITYSLVGDVQSSRFSGGILHIYQTISQSFVHFFQKLGLSPQLQSHSRRQRAAQASPVCFVVPSAFEILINGRKIIGSAQRQTSTAFLQHGTLPLTDQVPLLSTIFKNTPTETLSLKITALETLGIMEQHSLEDIWQLLVDSFQEVFHIDLQKQNWSAEEKAAIEKESVNFQPILL